MVWKPGPSGIVTPNSTGPSGIEATAASWQLMYGPGKFPGHSARPWLYMYVQIYTQGCMCTYTHLCRCVHNVYLICTYCTSNGFARQNCQQAKTTYSHIVLGKFSMVRFGSAVFQLSRAHSCLFEALARNPTFQSSGMKTPSSYSRVLHYHCFVCPLLCFVVCVVPTACPSTKVADPRSGPTPRRQPSIGDAPLQMLARRTLPKTGCCVGRFLSSRLGEASAAYNGSKGILPTIRDQILGCWIRRMLMPARWGVKSRRFMMQEARGPKTSPSG